MNIYLVGYRCTGKTTVGKELSEEMGWDFIDADHVLVENQGRSVAEIVETGGWETFRDLEAETLMEISETPNHIIATGGGVILRDENIRKMKETGIVIWLYASNNTILNRMLNDSVTDEQRPSLTDNSLEKEIIETMKLRKPLYEKSMNFSVDTDGKSINEIISEINDKVKELIH